jgi:hypothetical protein
MISTMPRTSHALAAVAVAVAASGLTGCSSWGCNTGSSYDPAADAQGEATPRAALAAWLDGDHGSAPDSGWHRSVTRRGTTWFVNGHWSAGVAEAPGGGYLISTSSCSTSR